MLDGDDLFKTNKIKILNKLRLDKKIKSICIITKKFIIKKITIENKKNIKEFLYKKLFNDWPEKINTSSIVISADLLKKFYRNHNPYFWKYLAIDVQVVLYYFYKKIYFLE